MSFQNLWTNMFKSQSSASASSDNQLHETSNSTAMRPPHSEGVSRPNCGQERERERSLPKAKRRWNPKREQIQILEDILNSGRVSPSKEEIKKIRTQLEKFGQVTEASVFYWFQNRKSKSKAKRRQHQLQAAAQISKSGTEAGTLSSSSPASTTTTSSSVQSKAITNLASSPVNSMQNNIGNQPPSPFDVPVSSFVGHQFNLQVNEEISANQYSGMQAIREDLQVNEEMSLNQYNNMQQAIGGAGAGAVGGQGILNDGTGGVQEEPIINANPSITVFINDIPVEVPMGPINFRAFFGDNSVLIHSSGQSVLVNEWGFTTEGLEHGAIYFLF